MAKKGKMQNNQKRARMIAKYRDKREALKQQARDPKLSPEEQIQARMELNKLPVNGAQIRYKNRCNLTGRPHSYYRRFGVSRIMVRELASNGQLPGVTKSSW